MNPEQASATYAEQFHKVICPVQELCKYEGATTPHMYCTMLDSMLVHHAERVLHAQAGDLKVRWEQMNTRARNVHGPGVLWSVRETDPFEEVQEGGGMDMLSPKSVDGYMDCSECEKGIRHHHRKSDDSLVQLKAQE